jgi:hypothetical protein
LSLFAYILLFTVVQAPPGKFGALVDIGVADRVARIRLVDNISCPIPSENEEFWKLPAPPELAASEIPTPVVPGGVIPNIRYSSSWNKPDDEEKGCNQGFPLMHIDKYPINVGVQREREKTQTQLVANQKTIEAEAQAAFDSDAVETASPGNQSVGRKRKVLSTY